MLARWYIGWGAKYFMILYIEATKATNVTGVLSAKQNELLSVFCLREIKGVACVAFVAFQGVFCR